MQYGQIAKKKRINATIYQCFEYLSEQEARKFVRKFKDQPDDKVQWWHTFRELILGAFLAKNGFHVQSDYRIDTKTPDWCVVDDSLRPRCIVELVSFHLDADTSEDMARQFQERGIWCNFEKPNTTRLYHAIWEKASVYKPLANTHDLPYVVAVFGDFVDIKEEELDECLFAAETGLFEAYPEVSGLLFFEEKSLESYAFIYKPNPRAVRGMSLPSGGFQKYRDRA